MACGRRLTAIGGPLEHGCYNDPVGWAEWSRGSAGPAARAPGAIAAAPVDRYYELSVLGLVSSGYLALLGSW